ncbi:MAG: 2-C-methyl-D-erythritol 4-phosphate cytidylyltransferase [Dehalococcoidia bacterium]|nr:2-C-methyl-D-erythritol 4-phosphate cytidylyltransferase [Dehalococcoidia bacterium]MDH4300409.1 2-C-methyl-D-erythritol 4-phosphate cytidylyltransferase [Dehalococcoidia bacterium]MDH4367034.1 2-C-methyl-D-erythritol 4-phosphate cytidylyltransferase [Dehalococcoidia bacterium]
MSILGGRARDWNPGFSKIGVVIVAAGTSQRMTGVNKLFAPLKGKPLLAWSVDTCQRCKLVGQIVVVLNDKDLARGRKLRKERNWSKVTLCRGGARRQDSVTEGLRQVKDCCWVMIHDGARPFLATDLIEDGLKTADEFGSAVASVPVKDTIKLGDGEDSVKETLRRDRLWAAQTPQIFSFDIITRAYQNLAAEVTDDATAVERLGYKVHLYMGDYRNIKVTTPEDLALARVIAREWKQDN